MKTALTIILTLSTTAAALAASPTREQQRQQTREQSHPQADVDEKSAEPSADTDTSEDTDTDTDTGEESNPYYDPNDPDWNANPIFILDEENHGLQIGDVFWDEVQPDRVAYMYNANQIVYVPEYDTVAAPGIVVHTYVPDYVQYDATDSFQKWCDALAEQWRQDMGYPEGSCFCGYRFDVVVDP